MFYVQCVKNHGNCEKNAKSIKYKTKIAGTFFSKYPFYLSNNKKDILNTNIFKKSTHEPQKSDNLTRGTSDCILLYINGIANGAISMVPFTGIVFLVLQKRIENNIAIKIFVLCVSWMTRMKYDIILDFMANPGTENNLIKILMHVCYTVVQNISLIKKACRVIPVPVNNTVREVVFLICWSFFCGRQLLKVLSNSKNAHADSEHVIKNILFMKKNLTQKIGACAFFLHMFTTQAVKMDTTKNHVKYLISFMKYKIFPDDT
uniref:Uncharacterized protein n=1 Tax=Lotharella vacuolata TaxID=74820 RepID=A0A0H5BKC4_9EUKA|nr:hypothetical protein [Lotharella vacuolata]BAS01675.1 hypothetical protein [Lotharella vacuolata]